MALTLSGRPSAEQALSQDFPRLCKSVIFFGSAFDGTGFDSVAAQGVDLQVAQGLAGVGMGQSAKGIGKADAVHGDFLAYRGRVHDRADQVVDEREHRQFLKDAGHRLTV